MHADACRCVGKVISGVGDFVCVCVTVRPVKERRLELPTPNLVLDFGKH